MRGLILRKLEDREVWMEKVELERGNGKEERLILETQRRKVGRGLMEGRKVRCEQEDRHIIVEEDVDDSRSLWKQEENSIGPIVATAVAFDDLGSDALSETASMDAVETTHLQYSHNMNNNYTSMKRGAALDADKQRGDPAEPLNLRESPESETELSVQKNICLQSTSSDIVRNTQFSKTNAPAVTNPATEQALTSSSRTRKSARRVSARHRIVDTNPEHYTSVEGLRRREKLVGDIEQRLESPLVGDIEQHFDVLPIADLGPDMHLLVLFKASVWMDEYWFPQQPPFRYPSEESRKLRKTPIQARSGRRAAELFPEGVLKRMLSRLSRLDDGNINGNDHDGIDGGINDGINDNSNGIRDTNGNQPNQFAESREHTPFTDSPHTATDAPYLPLHLQNFCPESRTFWRILNRSLDQFHVAKRKLKESNLGEGADPILAKIKAQNGWRKTTVLSPDFHPLAKDKDVS
jgi:hypothetical protein